MDYSRHIIVKSLIWKILERFSGQAIAFIVAIVLARILSPSDFGQIAIIIAIMTISDVIIQGGLNMAVVQKKNPDDLDYSTIFYFSILISMGLYAAVWLFAVPIANFFHQNTLVTPMRILCLSLIFYAFNSVQRAYVSKNMMYRAQFTATLAAVICAGTTGIILACKGMGVWALVWYYLLTAGLTSLFMWFTVKWRPLCKFSIERFVPLFRFGWKVMLSNTIISVFNNARSFIIGHLYPAGQLGLYDRGRQFPALAVENINASVQTVIFPVLSEYQDNVIELKKKMRKSVRMCTFIIFPMIAWLFAAAPQLILLILTDKWMDAVPFMRIFCLAYMLLPLQLANIEAIKSLGHSDVTLRIEIIKKAFEAVVLVISVKLGINAIAWGVVICNIAGIIINLWPNIKYLRYSVREQISDFLPQLIISIIMGAGIFLIGYIGMGLLWTVLAQIFCGVLVYFALAWAFRLESLSSIVEIIKNSDVK